MGKHGQNNYKGINAQTWAAMSLFLQYLRYQDFSYIQLEASRFEDFNLVFKDGHKIICESKAWAGELNFSHLKKILDSILKKNVITEKDEILITCTKLNKTLRSKVDNMKYWSKFIAPDFKKRKYSGQQIAILDKVRFWEIQEKDNHLIVYSLFGELLDFWLPEDELECKADSILIKRINEGSAKGEVYNREDIIDEIDSMRKKASKYSGYFDDERVKTEAQLQNLIKAVDNNKAPEWALNQLSALTSKPALMFFALDRIKDKKIDKLADWKDLWELYRIYRFSFTLFGIFEANLHTPENKQYILQFFKDNVSDVRRFYQSDFFDIDVVKITKKILQNDESNSFINDGFEIVKKLITEKKDDIFYLKAQQDNSWERGEVAKLLEKIYLRADLKLKEKIYNLITQAFNLIEDDGQFSRHTPVSIFEILKDWLSADLENRLGTLTLLLSEQFDKYYKKFGKRLKFKGWELMGGITSFSGNHYSVSDRHFIIYILKPALREYYQRRNKTESWDFIKNNCITSTNEVTEKKPDFLNRTVLEIVLERYKSEDADVSKEVKRILSEFILSRKGIPHKSELIYQSLLSDDFSVEKKWELVKISTDKFDTPINPFVEQIAGDLAAQGHVKALEVLRKWAASPEYFEKTRFPGNNLLRNIQKIFKTDPNAAIKQFEAFVSSEYFIGIKRGKLDRFEAYEWARFLNDILHKDFGKGLAIINKVKNDRSLSQSENEQILITACLYPLGEKTGDPKVLNQLYDRYVDLYLTELGDTITGTLTFSNPREQFLQFADKLVSAKGISNRIPKALRIIESFIDDPDPYLPGEDPSDPEDKYNEHQMILDGEDTPVITSIRGWCARVLGKCAVLDGREFIEEIINLTEKLIKDKNLYVKHMACFALTQLASIRLTVLPDDRDTLFFGSNKLEALQRARRVEKIAFSILDETARSSKNVQKVLGRSMIRVFDRIRSLNEKEALHFITTIKSFPDEVIAEAAPLFIYYAEFRKDGYKNWRWKEKDLYDDLEPKLFDDQKFKNILEELLKSRSPEITGKFSWQFGHLVGEISPDAKEVPDYFKVSVYYFNILSKRYDHHTFTSIYLFIQKNIGDHFKECFNLWQQCLKTEKTALEKLIGDGQVNQVNWYPFSYNGEILSTVYKQSDESDFLTWFKFLSEFPGGVILGEIKPAVELLKKFPKKNNEVEAIFDKLINHNSLYYNDKKEWKD